MNKYIYIYIYLYFLFIHKYIYIYVYPPTSPERGACLTPPSSLKHHPFPTPNPTGKAQQKTSVQPAKAARQPKSRNPTLSGTQATGVKDLGARGLKSWDLMI